MYNNNYKIITEMKVKNDQNLQLSCNVRNV
jgi:hypothetical protein